MSLKLTTSAFDHEGRIPDKYSKDGENLSPPLSWTGVPAGTKSLALIVDDPDAPSGVFVHWLVYGIPPGAKSLEEGQSRTETLAEGIRQGRNGFGELGYGGPQPPSGTHRYIFHLFALDQEPNLSSGVSRRQVDSALKGHVIAEAQLVGTYTHHEPGTQAAKVIAV